MFTCIRAYRSKINENNTENFFFRPAFWSQFYLCLSEEKKRGFSCTLPFPISLIQYLAIDQDSVSPSIRAFSFLFAHFLRTFFPRLRPRIRSHTCTLCCLRWTCGSYPYWLMCGFKENTLGEKKAISFIMFDGSVEGYIPMPGAFLFYIELALWAREQIQENGCFSWINIRHTRK